MSGGVDGNVRPRLASALRCLFRLDVIRVEVMQPAVPVDQYIRQRISLFAANGDPRGCPVPVEECIHVRDVRRFSGLMKNSHQDPFR